MKITKSIYSQIKDRIDLLEKNIDVEFVMAIVKKSDEYNETKFIVGISLSLISAFVFMLTDLWYDLHYIFIAQIVFLIMGYFLGDMKPIKRFLLGEQKLNEVSLNRARSLYVKSGLSALKKQNGILVFISEFEKKVHLISGHSFNKDWNNEVSKLVEFIKDDKALKGVEYLCDKLEFEFKETFPAQKSKVNLISNDIMIE